MADAAEVPDSSVSPLAIVAAALCLAAVGSMGWLLLVRAPRAEAFFKALGIALPGISESIIAASHAAGGPLGHVALIGIAALPFGMAFGMRGRNASAAAIACSALFVLLLLACGIAVLGLELPMIKVREHMSSTP